MKKLPVTALLLGAVTLGAKLTHQRDPALKGKDPALFKAYAVILK
jgi:hypothetical protein